MATKNGKTTYTKVRTTSARNAKAKEGEELLVVTRNEPGTFARLTEPLDRNNIAIECFTSYAWGNETAFRLVTDNNRKARDVLAKSGFNVQENAVTLWYMDNSPGALCKATKALAKASIDTYCSYMTTMPNSQTTIVAFNTNDAHKTLNILNEIA